ncbi:patatin-like phospholipase family protein [Mastigocladopsis repens]|uniref:patatin-like phospholipase family protein n=1 Tax=Mastigocladopsis repens TaxID=221287 RepID=UPI0002D481A2|nr:patatin-like phospholipase family protein [Mastigocladopsis repens]
MTIEFSKFGLVLAGGGAKGAYQAGAIEYLSKELQFVPHIIAGTSIGALNGAVLTSHQPFEQGVQRLLKLWEQLGQEEILIWNRQTILQTAISVAQTFAPNLGDLPSNFLSAIELLSDNSAIFDPVPIEKFLKQAVDLAGIRCGIELWVTIFPSLTIPGLKYDWRIALIDFVRGRLGTKAEWRCVQEITDNDALYNLLLASAAIPVAFPRRIVDGQSWVDGGLGDNVPLG